MGKEPFKPTDAEIVSQVLDGSVNAFESLIIRHKDLVLKIIKRHVPYNDVEEIPDPEIRQIIDDSVKEWEQERQ